MAQAKTSIETETTMIKGLGDQIKTRLGELPDYGREFYGAVDKSAHANPWLHIGVASVGALAIGYLIGRTFSGNSVSGFSVRPNGRLELDELE